MRIGHQEEGLIIGLSLSDKAFGIIADYVHFAVILADTNYRYVFQNNDIVIQVHFVFIALFLPRVFCFSVLIL